MVIPKKSDKEKSDEGTESDTYSKGTDGFKEKEKLLKAITDDSFTQKSEELLDNKSKGFRYGKVPTANLGKDGCLTSWKTFLTDMENFKVESIKSYGSTKSYVEFLDRDYKKFNEWNKKTSYVSCKEFEMKKDCNCI